MKNPVVMTQSVSSLFKENPNLSIEVASSIARFKSGDWGTSGDKELNDSDPKSAMGVYQLSDGSKVWIKSDNYNGFDGIDTVATIMLPSDY